MRRDFVFGFALFYHELRTRTAYREYEVRVALLPHLLYLSSSTVVTGRSLDEKSTAPNRTAPHGTVRKRRTVKNKWNFPMDPRL